MWKGVVALSMVCVALAPTSEPAQAADERGASERAVPFESPPRGVDATSAFEPNRGQTASKVDFLAHCRGYVAFLTEGGAATLRMPHGALRMRFEGASESAPSRALDRLPGRSNYLVGRDKSRWRKGIPHCARVAYDGVLSGVDVIWRTSERELEYNVVVAPDADVAGVRLRFDGADSVAPDERGRVVVKVGRESITMSAPRAYETVGGRRRAVAARTIVESDGAIAFVVGRRTPGAALVIDPALAASTYLGGTTSQYAVAVEADANGIYVTGASASTDFPTTTGAFQDSKGDSSTGLVDAFVTKFDQTGTSVVYSTYLGGSDNDYSTSLFLNSDGSLFVGGGTDSNDYPLQDPYEAGRQSGFLSELNASGDGLVVSTYVGEISTRIGRDASGNVYLLPSSGRVQRFDEAISELAWTAGNRQIPGSFSAYDFAVVPSGTVWVAGQVQDEGVVITTSDAYQTEFGGTSIDGYFFQYDANGDRGYSSLFGGSRDDAITAIALDGSGRVVISGTTRSDDLPTLNARQSTLAGSTNCFVARFDSAGRTLQWSTYHGGSGTESISNAGFRTNARGDVCLIGITTSTVFPILNAVQSVSGGGSSDGFAAVFADDGSLRMSTYLGGSDLDFILGGAFVGDTAVAVAGGAYSTDYPTSSAYQSSVGSPGTELEFAL